MIVDAYTHIWDSPRQLGKCVKSLAATQRTGPVPQTDDRGLPLAHASLHQAACKHADVTIVVGFKSHALAADVPNQYVAGYVREQPAKLVGFAGIDPAVPTAALEDIDEARSSLNLHGLAISPANQHVHPTSTASLRICERAQALRMPILIHQGPCLTAASRLEFARPLLLDELARDFPDLTMIISHMGYPWVDETLVLLAKHPNVYADISIMMNQPWLAFGTLVAAFQQGVFGKLLLASGFPFNTAAAAIESLYSVNQFSQGTGWPTIPREQLRTLVEKPTLEILGIQPQVPASASLHRQ